MVGLLQSQAMPENNPRLTILPGIRTGLAPARLIPGTHIVSSGPAWPAADTTWSIGFERDIQFLSYSWLDLVWPQPGFSAVSAIGRRRWTALNATELPPGFETTVVLNGGEISDLTLKPRITEWYLSNRFIYQYGRRGSVSAFLETGMGSLDLYQGSGNVYVLGGNSFAVALGLGWHYRLSGVPGTRLMVGVDLGYARRSFNIDPPAEGLSLTSGATTGLTPITALNLSSVTLKANLELGEFLRSRYIPYRDPYRLRLVTFGIGTGIANVQPGRDLQYATLGSSPSIGLLGRTYRHTSIDLFRYNWLYHFYRQADMDLLSGLSLNFSRSERRTPLPEDWPAQFLRDGAELNKMRLAPSVRELSLDHELIYPLFRSLFLNLHGGTGFAQFSLYENRALQRAITSAGVTWNLGAGLAWTFSGDADSKITIEAGFNFRHQFFEIGEDQDVTRADALDGPLTPLTAIDLSRGMIQVKLGLSFGGEPNPAYRAHKKFVSGDYIAALDIQEEFLQMNPRHHNVDQIELQMETVKDSLVATYYREVKGVMKRGRLEEAYSLIKVGHATRHPEVEAQVQELKSEIAIQSLRKASWALKEYDFAKAEDNILLALKSDPSVKPVAVILLSRSFLVRASILYQSGVYERSLVWLERAEALTNRYEIAIEKLRRKIGDGRLDDANSGIVREDRIVVYDAMLDARTLNPLLGNIVDRYLEGLDEAIDYYEDQEIGPLKRMTMDEILDDISGLDPDDFEPKIGMKAVLIARYVGEPQRRFREAEFELWVYEENDKPEIWLYIQDGKVQKIERK